MIDLHTHVLPGVDDGARSLEDAVEMCHLAAADGCTALVATPHQRRDRWWNGDRRDLAERLDRLREAVGESPRLFLGGEVRIDAELLGEVARLPGGEVQPLAGSRYLLLEFSHWGMTVEPFSLLHELTVGGWFPVLAHPELIHGLGEDLALCARLVAAGALLQVTAMSLTGDFGRATAERAHALVAAGLVHFVASDCHRPDWRPPGLKAAYSLLHQRYGVEVALQLVSDNPGAVIANQLLPVPVGG